MTLNRCVKCGELPMVHTEHDPKTLQVVTNVKCRGCGAETGFQPHGERGEISINAWNEANPAPQPDAA